MTFLIKILAGILTVLGAAGIGSSYAKKLNNRQGYSDGIITDTNRLFDEITIYKTPLSSAVMNVSLCGGDFYKEVGDRLKEEKNVKKAVKKTLEAALNQRSITEKQYELIKELFSKLGEGSVTEQHTVIEAFLKSYKAVNEEMRAERSKGERIYRIIGTASGLTLFLMLV